MTPASFLANLATGKPVALSPKPMDDASALEFLRDLATGKPVQIA